MSAFQNTNPRWATMPFVFLGNTFSAIRNALAPLRLLDQAQPPAQRHGFTSDAFVANGVVRPITAPYFWQPFKSWRLMSLFQFGMTCLLFIEFLDLFKYYLVMFFVLELVIRVTSFVLRKAAIINTPLTLMSILKKFMRYNVGFTSCSRLLYLIPVPNPLGHKAAVALRIVSRLDRISSPGLLSFSAWSTFWSLYFITCVRRKRFSQNYIEAWRQKYPNRAISVFFDRSGCVRIPCPDDDAELNGPWLWNHLSFFYHISRIEGDISMVLLPKSLVRLEIIQVRLLLSP